MINSISWVNSTLKTGAFSGQEPSSQCRRGSNSSACIQPVPGLRMRWTSFMWVGHWSFVIPALTNLDISLNRRKYYLEWTMSTLFVSCLRPSFRSPTTKWQLSGASFRWMGERSSPITVAFGNWFATSTHQAPDPVPTSRIFIGIGEIGVNTLPPRSSRHPNCKLSSRLCSSSSLGSG